MKIREIGEEDLDGVIELLAENFPRRRPAYWRRGFQNMRSLPAMPDHPRYGYLLDIDGTAQGVLLLLSAQVGDGLCRINFSTWCARPAYRSMAIFLHRGAMKQSADSYLNLSPAANVVPILEASGFNSYTSGLCVLDARAALRAGQGYRLTRYEPRKDQGLPAAAALIAARHHRYGCTVLVLNRDSESAELLVYRVKWIKGILPCAQMLHGVPERVLVTSGPLMRHLLRRGIAFALVDMARGDIDVIGARFFAGRNLRYAKGVVPAVGDMLDSEFALFGP